MRIVLNSISMKWTTGLVSCRFHLLPMAIASIFAVLHGLRVEVDVFHPSPSQSV